VIPQRAVMEAQAIQAMMLRTTNISMIENPARCRDTLDWENLIFMVRAVVTPLILGLERGLPCSLPEQLEILTLTFSPAAGIFRSPAPETRSSVFMVQTRTTPIFRKGGDWNQGKVVSTRSLLSGNLCNKAPSAR